MERGKYKPGKIIMMLREAEVDIGKEANTSPAWGKLGMSANPFYRWRKEYSGMQLNQARKLKRLEQENTQLKK